MKKVIILLLVILNQTLFGQVTLNPAIVTQNDSVTILYDATLGNQGLIGVGPVYMHSGVITNLSSSPTAWRHVQGNWGVHDAKMLMTSLGNNMHSLKMHINTFYNVPANETVSALAFVFRNVDGSKEGKTASNGDIFVPISTGGYNGGITSHPQEQYIIIKGDTVELDMNVSSPSSMDLYLNGNLVASDTNTTNLTYDFLSGNDPAGLYQFVLNTTDGSQSLTDTVNILSHGAPATVPLPSYAKEGIQALNDSTMYFQIRAPYKSFIYLIGDFNDWKFLPNYQLNKTPAGDYFWIEITGLDKNKEYAFQYLIDEEMLRVSDPYVEKILDPWNDPYISNNTYPNLKAYPSDKTTGVVGVFQIEEPTYNWSSNSYTKPAKEELIVYELLIRDFDQAHDYNSVIEKLDYIQGMGANAIELMPIMEFEGNESWGYNPSFLFAPDKYYGPKNEFKRFVDSCHSRGIAVILDIVLNHAFGQSPMVQMYFDPNAGQWGQPTAQSPWFNEVPKHDFNVGYDFNHQSNDTKYYSKEVLKHWVEEYQIDGYRFDLSKGLTQKNTLGNIGAWNAYDQQRINILDDYANTIWGVDSGAYVILEHFADNSEETVLSNNGQMLWGNTNHDYNEATMGYPSNLIGVSHQSRNWSDMNLIGYMESHDEERLMYKNLNFGNSSANYNTKDKDTALSRMALASAFFYTIPGPKMLWQFGELGYDFSINYCTDGTVKPECRVGNKPIRWDYYTEPNRKSLYDIVSELNHLRRTNPVFSYDNNHELSVNGLTKRIKLSDSNLDVVVIGNFGVTPQTINPSFHNTGWWYDHFQRDSINVSNVNTNISLAPGEWHIYTSKPLPTAISIDELEQAYNFSVYPNPSHGEFTLSADNGNRITRVSVYDNIGRLVYSNTYLKQTETTVKIDITNQTNGLYFYRVETERGTFSGKIFKSSN